MQNIFGCLDQNFQHYLRSKWQPSRLSTNFKCKILFQFFFKVLIIISNLYVCHNLNYLKNSILPKLSNIFATHEHE